MREPDPTFSDAERTALDSWRVGAPSSDLADRAVAQWQHERRARRRAIALRLVVGAAAVLVALFVRGLLAWPSSGEATPTSRATLEVGPRALAVAEAGSRLDWATSWSGETVVNHTDGEVFYRVEPGSHFDVQTPAGRVQVRGTCFRIEVNDMNRTTITGAAAGAALASAVWLTVFEGRVLVTSGPGPEVTEVSAGQRVALPGAGAGVTAAKATSVGTTSASDPAARAPEPLGSSSGGALPATTEREVERLRVRVRELETALQAQVKASEKINFPPVFDLTPAQLTTMAEHCELAWDMVPIDASRVPTISTDDAKALALTDQQTKQVNAAYADYNRAMVERVRSLYLEMTHDPSAGSMAVQAMIDEANDKTSQVERQRAYQRIAAERAEGRQAPADLAAVPPYERLQRLLVTAGDDLEGRLAEALGPATARQLRELKRGFSSQHRSGDGCPQP